MAITLVQSQVFHGSTGSPAPISYPGATTAGNMLSMHGNWVGTSGPSAVTDSASGTWTFSGAANNQNPPTATVTQAGTTFGSFCAWRLNAGPVTSVTVTVPGLTFATLVIAEWSGADREDNGASFAGAAVASAASVALQMAGGGELVLLAADTFNAFSAGPSQGQVFPGGNSPYVQYALGQSGRQVYSYTTTVATDQTSLAVAAFLPPYLTPPPVSQRTGLY